MKKIVVSLCSLMLVAGAGHAQFFDNFNGATGPGLAAGVGLGVGTFSTTGGNAPHTWTVTGGNLDFIGLGGFGDPYPGNGQYIDMDGSASPGGTTMTSEAFALAGNTNYALSFNLGKNGSSAEFMTVSVLTSALTPVTQAGFIGGASATGAGSIATFLVQSGGVFNWTQVPGVAAARISFAHLGNDSAGYIVDDVRLVGTAIPTGNAPEPASLALIGMFGVPFLGMLRRRK